MKKIVFFLAITSSVFSQSKLTYTSNKTLFAKVDSLANVEKYNEVLDLLNAVNPNDSISRSVNIKKAYYNLQLKKYDEVIKICDLGIKENVGSEKTVFFINKAAAYYSADKKEKAVEVYTEAIKDAPKNSDLYRRRAGILLDLNKYKETYQDIKTAYLLNPYNINLHLLLGDMFYKEDKYAQALMAYNFYLLLSPDGSKSFDILNFLNEKFSSKSENSPTGFQFTKNDESYEDIDNLIQNRVAIGKKYKVKNKINIAYVKQNHLLLSQLNELDLEQDFFTKYYYEIHKWINDNKLFNDFIYTVCYTIKNEKYKKYIAKNEKKAIAFNDAFTLKYIDLVEKRIELFDGKKQEVSYTYKDYELQSIGLKKNDKYNGKWMFFNEDTTLKAEGNFDEQEKRVGEWTWYSKSGKILEKVVYKDGKATGPYIQYHENGNIKTKANYKNNSLDGNYKAYNSLGALIEDKNFKEGNLEGDYLSFYDVGKVAKEYAISYKNDKIVGTAYKYFENNTKEREMSFVDSKKSGLSKDFFLNGKEKYIVNYKEGQYQGNYKEFYANGQLYQEGEYLDNKITGQWKIFYNDGKLRKIKNYLKGKTNGEQLYYSHLGYVYEKFDYRRDKLIKASYFDKDGNSLYAEKKSRNELDFKGYSVLGNLKSEGLYNIKGGKSGDWKFYSRNGKLSSKETYKDDEIEGESTDYYENGNTKEITNYVNGLKDGYSVKYYNHGKMQQQGYYVKGEPDKEWRYYYKDGTISNIYYYHKGEFNNIQKDFYVDGKLKGETKYNYGKIVSYVEYSPVDGKIINTIDYETIGSKPKVIISKYFNGVNKDKATYVNGVLHGLYEYYHTNGKIAYKGNYINNSADGLWQYFDDEGKLYKEIDYKLGSYNGKLNQYHENGNIDDTRTYIMGYVDGANTSYHEDGKTIDNIINYSYGFKNGTTNFYGDKGDLQLVRYYDMGILTAYSYLDSSGKLKEPIPITNETVKAISYYQNGNKAREFELDAGLFVNDYIEYYSNGQLKRKSTYDNDEDYGKYVRYFENGKVSKESDYLDGELQGESKTYFKNGQLKSVYNYINDKKSGPFTVYNQDGTIKKEGVCYDGYEF